MTQQIIRRTRLQLDAALASLTLAGACLMAVTAYAINPGDVTTAARTVAGLSPLELMSGVAVLALALCGYLIRLLFTRLLTVLDENARANKEMARLLAERPCIRRKEND